MGGWLVQYASWHWIFLINVPVGLAGCLATLRAVQPEQPEVSGQH
jgi:predicted MFS family arabinose efflux permease